VATLAEWVEGARPRTLPAAVTPVVVGTAAAANAGRVTALGAVLALVVSVALQVAVNYANDYSDGVRGADRDRVGPLRLVGSGAASPGAVRGAAFAAFGVAAAAGVAVTVATGSWWLLAVGGAAVLAAWFYTGGRSPYGYRGYGELGVFVFFGLVAVLGTCYLQASRLTAAAGCGAVGCGALSCAILVANNLRDVPTDAAAGKRTLAVRMGDRRARWLYAGLLALAAAAAVAGALVSGGWPALALLATPLAVPLLARVRSGAAGLALVPVLAGTGRLLLGYGLLFAGGLVIARR
jgi:1,4-dihydroxy-2-naphthoate octaprenyltransferase